MSIEWKRLIDVRERHRQLAQEVVARDRRDVEESRSLALKARQQLEAQIAGKAAHWRSLSNSLDGQSCDVAGLRDASAWSRALDERIAQAGELVSQVQAVVALHQESLEASSAQLREAVACAERARQMQQRAQMQVQRRQDLRMDDAAEEAASQAWALRRSS